MRPPGRATRVGVRPRARDHDQQCRTHRAGAARSRPAPRCSARRSARRRPRGRRGPRWPRTRPRATTWMTAGPPPSGGGRRRRRWPSGVPCRGAPMIARPPL
jgi:hypothetical protein